MKKYKLTPLGKFTIGLIFIVVVFVFFNRITNTLTQGITIYEDLSSIKVDTGRVAKVDAGGVAKVDAGRVAKVDAGRVAKVDAGRVAKVDTGRIVKMNAGRVAKVDAGRIAKVEAGRMVKVDAGSMAKTDTESIAKANEASVIETKPTKVMVNSDLNADRIKNDEKNGKSAIDGESAMFNLKNIASFMPGNRISKSNIETRENQKSNVEIFYIPHPDDELLSMGVAIAESVKSGSEVHVVLYSHGYGSSAIKAINGEVYCQWHKRIHNPKQEGYNKLTEKDFGGDRVKEFVSSAVSLGVKIQNIHILNFYEDSVTPYEVKLVMLGFEKQFPNAFHNAASYHDEHPFHRKIGEALLDLYNNKEVNAARFFISPVQWNAISGKIISNEQSVGKVKKSIEAYKLWEPKNEHFGIGYHSYRIPFDKISNKIMSKYHNPND